MFALKWLWSCLWLGLVVAVNPRVVHQPDGIISIITELEPEKAPVAYLQAVEEPPLRRTPVREAIDSQSPKEEVFRVRSAKIRIVDPETGFKVVHESTAKPVQVKVGVQNESEETEIPSGEAERRSERRSEIRAEPATDFNVIHPPRYQTHREEFPSSFNQDTRFRDKFQRRRKPGKYGHQSPRRDNTVRTEKTTRIRNNNEPSTVFKETIVRPASTEDTFTPVKKQGKPGRYVSFNNNNSPTPHYRKPVNGRFRTHQVSARNPVLGIGEVIDNTNVGSEILPGNNPDRRKTKKEYSSKTVVRFPDGHAQENENRVESSSKYKTGSNSRESYRSPSFTESQRAPTVATSNKNVNRKLDGKDGSIQVQPNSIRDKIEKDPQPLPQESSFVGAGVSDSLDDGVVDDGGVIYSGGGYGGGVDVGVGVGLDGYGDSYGGYGKEKHFEKDKGKHYIAAHESAHGAKGQKGHHNEEAFAKGQSEKHGHDENKGYHEEKEGDKKSHLDKSSHYAEGHKASDGGKVTDYHKDKGHRKGHKKSGFRTVHHKDEYKKKEEFFDEEHDGAGHQQHGHKSQEHHEKAGEKDKKAHLDAGHYHGSRGHEGGHEKGHGYNQHKGFNKEKGHSGHYGNEEEYGKKGGHKEGEVHGHSEYGGYH